ncbi:hypothetical protein L1987_07070 [Smallanthus sonchifolius]|uniref:Uncharacterized protein n=1 Tax=Smallanthus sonchifolius TaxID=185202 RepID=A0ACB9K013_9ASTR|nr:hypothetical protein L1987_07070 [Smallanthus sonchifolius]
MSLEKKHLEIMERCRKLEDVAEASKKDLAMIMYGILANEPIGSPPRRPPLVRDPYLMLPHEFFPPPDPVTVMKLLEMSWRKEEKSGRGYDKRFVRVRAVRRLRRCDPLNVQ